MALSRWMLIGLLALGCHHEPLDVAQVDLERMQGKWFEVASLPRLTQKDCTGTTADYQLRSQTELLVINECHEGNLSGPVRRFAARAVASDPEVPGKLSLNFGYAYGDYWVIDVGEHYEYLVVGHPTRDYLWILSRERTLPRATLDGVLERAQQKGFATGTLHYTAQ
ncbi:MAG: lipocalin family protein [Polyangiaceae bacterium]